MVTVQGKVDILCALNNGVGWLKCILNLSGPAHVGLCFAHAPASLKFEIALVGAR